MFSIANGFQLLLTVIKKSQLQAHFHTENWSTFLRMLKKNWLSLHVRLLTVTYASPDAVLS